jgi:serine/threonine protein kinase
MAPELFEGSRGTEASDQFAFGVTLYRMFTGRYPYGEIEAFSRPRFGTPVLACKVRPDLPAWLEAVMSRAVTVDRDQGSETCSSCLPRSKEVRRTHRVSSARARCYDRNPLRFWQLVSALLAIASDRGNRRSMIGRLFVRSTPRAQKKAAPGQSACAGRKAALLLPITGDPIVGQPILCSAQ